VVVDTVHRRLAGGLSARRQALAGAAAAVVLAALTAVLRASRDDVSLALVFLLYLAVVVGLSAAGGPLVGMGVAVAAFLLTNYFFTQPFRTFKVADAEVLTELLIFLAVSGTVATLVDTAGRRRITIEEQAAEAAVLAAANDLRTALLRAVSHDLRAPLTTAKMATSSLLADDVTLAPGSRNELLAFADREIDRLAGIVENLLDAGRLEAGVLHADVVTVDAAELVQRAVAALPHDDRHHVVVAGDWAATVRTDPALVERVLVNLIANARAAAPANPVALQAHAGPDGTTTVIDVVDHGPGMSAELRPTAFEPFQRLGDRSSMSGIGLGLAICKGFCDAVGATLELLDTPGGGLTVRLVLPIAREVA
jgi:two-component system sensor histidine kinase KdpD